MKLQINWHKMHVQKYIGFKPNIGNLTSKSSTSSSIWENICANFFYCSGSVTGLIQADFKETPNHLTTTEQLSNVI